MISVDEAKDIVRSNIEPLPPVTIPLEQASGYVLAGDIYASIDIPSFPQSSMDGYALSYNDYKPGKRLEIAGEVPAGVSRAFDNLSDKAIRIFTGAPVPEGVDTVVMQEKVTIEDTELLILDEQLVKGSNVRLKGSEIKAGALALQSGTFLSPAALGFLAGIGASEVKVYAKPRITIILTGKELQAPGKPLLAGQVYESNSITLKAVLQQLHITNVAIHLVDDDLGILNNALENALLTSDVVLLTGGISVGDYDFVLQATENCGVKKLFHKIKQRPGKPLFFGKKGEKVVFGLPGNPSSVLTCFYEYVIPAIEQLTFRKSIISVEQLPLTKALTKKTGLTHFLKGLHNGKTVSSLDAQESYRLSSFARANCLIVLEENKEDFSEGDMVEVHLLPL
jgi:molybdopterin molybdotransferase